MLLLFVEKVTLWTIVQNEDGMDFCTWTNERFLTFRTEVGQSPRPQQQETTSNLNPSARGTSPTALFFKARRLLDTQREGGEGGESKEEWMLDETLRAMISQITGTIKTVSSPRRGRTGC